MRHIKDRPYDYLATSLNSLIQYWYISLSKVNSLSCKDCKSLKTHKKLFHE